MFTTLTILASMIMFKVIQLINFYCSLESYNFLFFLHYNVREVSRTFEYTMEIDVSFRQRNHRTIQEILLCSKEKKGGPGGGLLVDVYYFFGPILGDLFCTKE